MTTWLFGFEAAARDGALGTLELPLDRLALEEFDRAERRRVARREMRSEHSSVAERVRAWERLHGLQLPRDPNHISLRLVSRDTGLSIEAVLEEQRLRQTTAPAFTKSTT